MSNVRKFFTDMQAPAFRQVNNTNIIGNPLINRKYGTRQKIEQHKLAYRPAQSSSIHSRVNQQV